MPVSSTATTVPAPVLASQARGSRIRSKYGRSDADPGVVRHAAGVPHVVELDVGDPRVGVELGDDGRGSSSPTSTCTQPVPSTVSSASVPSADSDERCWLGVAALVKRTRTWSDAYSGASGDWGS